MVAQQVGGFAEYITHSLRETLLHVGTDHYARAQSNFRAGDCAVERRTQLGEEVDVCALVTVPVQKHRSHEGRMRPGVVIADDGSALVDDHSDEARAETENNSGELTDKYPTFKHELC